MGMGDSRFYNNQLCKEYIKEYFEGKLDSEIEMKVPALSKYCSRMKIHQKKFFDENGRPIKAKCKVQTPKENLKLVNILKTHKNEISNYFKPGLHRNTKQSINECLEKMLEISNCDTRSELYYNADQIVKEYYAASGNNETKKMVLKIIFQLIDQIYNTRLAYYADANYMLELKSDEFELSEIRI